MIWVRSLLYVVWLYGSMTVIGAALAPLVLIDKRWAGRAARAWSKTALWGVEKICGLKVDVRGLENLPKGPVLIAAKHQAMLDTLIPFAVLTDPAVALKRELIALPVFGWYAKRAGMIVLDRAARSAALRKMLREARVCAEQGQQIFIFPEGHRQPVGAAPDYKPGVAALYLALKMPCVPVALNTGLYWPAHGVKRKPGVAIIEFLPAIPPGLSREDFMAQLQTRIEQRSDALAQKRSDLYAPA